MVRRSNQSAKTPVNGPMNTGGNAPIMNNTPAAIGEWVAFRMYQARAMR